jgi:hypothetical protein
MEGKGATMRNKRMHMLPVLVLMALGCLVLPDFEPNSFSSVMAADSSVVIRNFVLPEFPYHRVVGGVEGKLTATLTVNEKGEVVRVTLISAELNLQNPPYGVIDVYLQKERLLKWTFERVGAFVTPPPDSIKVILEYQVVRTNLVCSLEPTYELYLGPTIRIKVTGYMPLLRQ